MTPEEKFNREIWYVLEEIHKKSLYVKKGAPISYELNPNLDSIKINSEDEEKILYKLEEWQIIDIVNNGSDYVSEYSGGPHFKVIELKKDVQFNEYYQKYGNIFSPNAQPDGKNPAKPFKEIKTFTDYIVEAINYFKDEYNKVRISGLIYEYYLGENFERANGEMSDEDADDHTFKLRAIDQLKEVGFITTYDIEERVSGCYVLDFALCKIDENQITNKKQKPLATEAGAEALANKVIHEHTHRFENSIQEKDIALIYKQEKNSSAVFYITKKDDDFFYKGRYINLSKKTDYYKVFCSLYAKLPKGGEINYRDLISDIESRLPKTKGKTTEEMQKFIQRNLTDKSNGFMRYAGIPETEDNGKPLIEVNRGSGVIFNNTTG